MQHKLHRTDVSSLHSTEVTTGTKRQITKYTALSATNEQQAMLHWSRNRWIRRTQQLYKPSQWPQTLASSSGRHV